jgi:hypothetical protein
MLATAGACERASVRATRGSDSADVLAARPLAVGGAIEFYLKADQCRVTEQVLVWGVKPAQHRPSKTESRLAVVILAPYMNGASICAGALSP